MKKSDLNKMTSDEKTMISVAAKMLEVEKSKKNFSGNISKLKAEKILYKKGK